MMARLWICSNANQRLRLLLLLVVLISLLLLFVLLIQQRQETELQAAAATESEQSNKSSSILSALAGYYNISVKPVKTYYQLGEGFNYCQHDIKITSNNSTQASKVRSYFKNFPPEVLPIFPSQLQNLKERLLNATLFDLTNGIGFEKYIYDHYESIPSTHIRDGFTEPPKKWRTIHALQCVVIDIENFDILAISNKFWLGLRSMDVQLNKNTFSPGDEIRLKYIKRKDVRECISRYVQYRTNTEVSEHYTTTDYMSGDTDFINQYLEGSYVPSTSRTFKMKIGPNVKPSKLAM
jgi:hypothetical protein